jgi:hypothetical protein
MRTAVAVIVSGGVCLALVGCASEQPQCTGVMSDYSARKPHTAIPGALIYWNPAVDLRQYRAVLVAPVTVHFMNRNDHSRATPEDIAAFRRLVRDELTAAISKHMAIVTEPGPDVLCWRLRVNLRLTGSTDTPPPPWPSREYALGTADIDADAHDSISGELVAAYVSPRSSVESYTAFFLTSAPDPWEAARAVACTRIATIGALYSDRANHRSSVDAHQRSGQGSVNGGA